MVSRQQVARSTLWAGVERWGRQLVSLVVFAIVARLLSPEAFGLFALASVFVAFVRIVLDQGLADAVIQREDPDEAYLDTAFWVSVVLGAALSLGSFLAAWPVAGLFGEPRLEPVLQGLAPTFLVTALGATHQALLTRRFGYESLALRTLVATVASGVVGVGLALKGQGVWALVGMSLTSAVVGTALLWWSSGWTPRARFSRQHARALFAFGGWLTGTRLLNFVNRKSDDLLIGFFLGPTALGYYSVAYQVLESLTGLTVGVAATVAYPAFCRLQRDLPRLRAMFVDAVQLIALVTVPAYLGVVAIAPELVAGVFGEQWMPASPVLRALMPVGVLYAFLYLNGPALMAVGKPSWHLKLTLIQGVGSLVAYLIAVRWGIVAVAASYVVRGALTSPVALSMMRRAVGVRAREVLGALWCPLAAALPMLGAIALAKTLVGDLSPRASLLVYVPLGALVYAGAVWLLSPALARRAIELARSGLSRRRRAAAIPAPAAEPAE